MESPPASLPSEVIQRGPNIEGASGRFGRRVAIGRAMRVAIGDVHPRESRGARSRDPRGVRARGILGGVGRAILELSISGTWVTLSGNNYEFATDRLNPQPKDDLPEMYLCHRPFFMRHHAAPDFNQVLTVIKSTPPIMEYLIHINISSQ